MDRSSFRDLLSKDGAYTIHERTLQVLAVECYKASQNIGPSLLNDIINKLCRTNPKKQRGIC